VFKWLLPTIVAVLFGVTVLLSYLLPIEALADLREILVGWAAVLGAFALYLAYLNLLRVHVSRIFRKQGKHRFASMILVTAALLSLGLVVWQGPDGAYALYLVDYVLVPGQSALLALTAVTLVVTGMRVFRTRRHVNSALFIGVAVLTLLSSVPFVYPRIVRIIIDFMNATATGGMRGLLLGVILGITMTGLRIILGVDRPHSSG
jgi:hypothetical protein